MGILGGEYREGALILRILLITQLLNVASGSIGWLFVMTGHLQLNMVISFSSVVVNVFLIGILAKYFGITGAAIGGAISLLIINIVGLIQTYRVLGIQPYEWSFTKPIIAGTLTFLSVIFIR